MRKKSVYDQYAETESEPAADVQPSSSFSFLGIEMKNITRNPITSLAGAIIFILTVYAVYNGTATITEASPVFLLCLWLAGSKDPKRKKS